MIKKRILGNSGIEVNPVGLGCMGFSHAYGTPTDKSDAIKLIRNSYDMGTVRSRCGIYEACKCRI